MRQSGFSAIMLRSLRQIVGRPVYWCGFFLLPLFSFLVLAGLMWVGIPTQTPAAIVDRDGTALSRQITQNLASMQGMDYVEAPNSFTEARHMMQEGKIYGFFMIPEDFQQNLLAGKGPEITYYTNMTYFVPGTLLFRTFMTTSLYSKAGLAMSVLDATGAETAIADPAALLQPVNISTRGLGNPGLNYAIYLGNSFIPCCLQLMILLVTCFSLGQEIKYGGSTQLMRMSRGSIIVALAGKLLPQTLIWMVVCLFMTSWMYFWNGYPVYGNWGWIALSQFMFVLATQALAIVFFGITPNLRMSLSQAGLLGILSFSIAAFSFPVESMYGAVGIFSWMMPIRYQFLIYIDQVLNARPIFYSRIWYAAYCGYMLLPLLFLPRIKKAYLHPVYAP